MTLSPQKQPAREKPMSVFWTKSLLHSTLRHPSGEQGHTTACPIINCSLQYRRSMFHGQAGKSLWTWYTNPSTTFSTPSQLHLSTPTWASQGPGPAGTVRPALKLELCCPAQRPTHTQPWASQRLRVSSSLSNHLTLRAWAGLLF